MHASRCALAVLCLLSSNALAHDADLVSAAARQGEGGAVDEVLTLTAPTLGLLAPLDVDRDGALTQAELEQRRDALAAGVWDAVPLFTAQGACARGETAAAIRDGYVELRARFACPPGPLRQTFQILSVLPPNYRVVVGRIEGGTAKGERFAQGNEQTVDLFDPAPSSAQPAAGSGPEGFAGWVALGVGHIFGGIDHLAFLLALLLVSGSWRRVLALVTTFTVAHSITLGATALGFVPLGAAAQRWVEALIALSIVAVAAENLLVKAPRHRVPMVFGFGLVHGFGFASVLQSYGLGASAAGALLGFNLGVELGQAACVAAVFPLVLLARGRGGVRPWVVRGGSLAVLVAGGVWLTQRIVG